MVLAFTVILVGICLCSCKIEKISSKKTKDVEYTIVPENEIPQEVKKVIDEKKGSEFKLAYTDPEYTYILIGYGKQDYQGYSIILKKHIRSLKSCLLSAVQAVFIRTEI